MLTSTHGNHSEYFSKTVQSVLLVQLDQIQQESELSQREILDAIEPNYIFQKLAEGTRKAKAIYAAYLSKETYHLIDEYLEKSRKECERIKPLWSQLDHFERNGFWESAKAGYNSGEAQIGAAIGASLFGPLGGILGGRLVV